jgi:serine phosphatase RsbU (regulator of sigma subunit)/pSer/pThr/pTyr-binding forkhead associated (FHA) protein
MEYFQILKGAGQGQRILLNGRSKVVLGRSAECDVVINDPAVSRAHAQVIGAQGKFYIEDLKSRNSTYVNGQPIVARTLLHDQDRVKICDFTCVFHDDEQTTPPVEPAPVVSAEDDPDSSSTIEVTLTDSTQQILQNQPAAMLNKLLEITTTFAQTYQLSQLLPRILERLFQLFPNADRGFILLQDEDTGQLVPRMVKTRHARDATTPRYSKRIVMHCLETRNALLSKDALHDPAFNRGDPGGSILEARIRSVMCVPLMARDTSEAFGVIQLDTQERSKRFTQEDLKLLVAVAGLAAIAIENARLHQDMHLREQMERDMALARQVQLSILPEQLPIIPGLEFFAHYASALEVGGDYYDFIQMPDRCLAVTIGDVVGKGMPAALLMAKLSSDVRYCLLSQADPAAAVCRLNHLLYSSSQQTDRFITLCVAVFDPADQSVTLVNAGHLTPLLFKGTTKDLEHAHPWEVGGLPVGIQKSAAYCSRKIRLEPGDGLIFFTDGVVEAEDKDGAQFQMDRVRETLRNGPYGAQAMGERLVAAVKQYSLGCKQHDDITVVCFGKV